MSDTNDFSGVKPGDKLWSLEYGEVVVERVSQRKVFACSVAELHESEWLVNGNVCANSATPDLYWAKPEIIAPPKPKRTMEKKWEIWVNVYPDGSTQFFTGQEYADSRAEPDRLGPAEKITITRMVPED